MRVHAKESIFIFEYRCYICGLNLKRAGAMHTHLDKLVGPRSRSNFKIARVSGPLQYKLQNRVNHSIPFVLFYSFISGFNWICWCRQTNHDKHCWQCHKESTTIFCTECTRSYHVNCIGRVDSCRPKKKCDQCKDMEKSELNCQQRYVDALN